MPEDRASSAGELVRIHGKSSFYWTARALAQSKRLRRIRVVCEPHLQEGLRSNFPDDSRFEFDDFGAREFTEDEAESLTASIQFMEHIGRERIKATSQLLKRNLSSDLVEKAVKRVLDVRFECAELDEVSLPLMLSNVAHHAAIAELVTVS